MSVARWTQAYLRAQIQAQAGEYAAASGLLTGVLGELAGVREPGGDDLAAKVHGLLGTNAMHLGDFAGSVRHTEQALRLCTATGDREGVEIYTKNLELARLVEAAERHDPNALRTIALRQRIATAQDLSDDMAYEASNRLLRPLVDHEPPEAVQYRAKIHGLIGLNLHRLGDRTGARHATQLALTESRRTGDEDGIRIYTANLTAIG